MTAPSIDIVKEFDRLILEILKLHDEDQDVKVYKMLNALSGGLKGYRQDITAFRKALTNACILSPHDAERLQETGIMLDRYGDDCFPPPNEKGQVHFGKAVLDAAARQILSLFHPIRELCDHRWDGKQSGRCLKCGAYIEERSP